MARKRHRGATPHNQADDLDKIPHHNDTPHQSPPPITLQRGVSTPPSPALTPQGIRSLQTTHGNRFVMRLLENTPAQSSQPKPQLPRTPGTIQRDGTGLAGKKSSKNFAKTVTKGKKNWDKLSTQQRITQLLEPANAQLAKVGVPRVTGLVDPLDQMEADNHANFVRGNWQVWFNANLLGSGLSDEQFGRLANTVYHECRHAEQTFRVARLMAAEGKSVTTIAQAIGIHQNIAQQAVDKPLNPKNKQEWEEAAAWKFNMEKGPGDTQSPADLVNQQKDDAMAEYAAARGKYRMLEGLFAGDTDIDERLRKQFAQTMQTKEGVAHMEKALKEAKSDYNAARETAKQAYLQYAMMPVEEDAWNTGALIQMHMGLEPSTAKQELDNLDKDEREMLSIGLVTLSTGSSKEKALAEQMAKLFAT